MGNPLNCFVPMLQPSQIIGNKVQCVLRGRHVIMRRHFNQSILTFLQQMMTTGGIVGHYTFSFYHFPMHVFLLPSAPSSSWAETNKDTEHWHIISGYFDITPNAPSIFNPFSSAIVSSQYTLKRTWRHFPVCFIQNISHIKFTKYRLNPSNTCT